MGNIRDATGVRTGFACSMLGQALRFDCADFEIGSLVCVGYGAAPYAAADVASDLHYVIESSMADCRFRLSREGAPLVLADDRSELLGALDRDLSVELQKRRPDLLFLHAAVLEWRGVAWVFVAPSGTGKSTLALALLSRGFRYMSDELAPIAVDGMCVHPYPRALCVKRPLPKDARRELPRDTIDLVDTLHLSARSLPTLSRHDQAPLGGVFVIARAARPADAHTRRIGTAEAAISLYANALNALAHPNRGLDAVLDVAARLPCFALAVADLDAACRRVLHVVAQTRQQGRTNFYREQRAKPPMR
jgi:hypothetical protein